jgi:hypothetical protein
MKTRPGQIGMAQVRGAQVRLAQLEAAQIGIGKVRRCNAAFLAVLVPGPGALPQKLN